MIEEEPDTATGKVKNIPATLQARAISVWLDNYDDIFSDFDPRPYEDRNISDDFLHEVQKFSREKETNIKRFILSVPASKRDAPTEQVIIKRLHHYFKVSLQTLKEKIRRKKRTAVIQTISGILMLISASYISLMKSDTFYMHILLVLLEPAGWFLMWTGLDNLIYRSREEIPDLKFYRKIAKSKITFIGF